MPRQAKQLFALKYDFIFAYFIAHPDLNKVYKIFIHASEFYLEGIVVQTDGNEIRYPTHYV